MSQIKLAVVDPRMLGGKRRRRRGAGFGDFIANTLGGIGSGLGGGVKNLVGSLFGGKRRRRRRGGAADVAVVAEPLSLFGKLNKVAQDSKVISKALKTFDLPFSNAAEVLGYGRKRRVVRKRKGGMAMTTSRRKSGGRLTRLNY